MRSMLAWIGVPGFVRNGFVEFFNRLLIRPADVLVSSPADPPPRILKIYPRIHRGLC